MPDELTGREVAGFRLGERLGSGGTGDVYVATPVQRGAGPARCVKVLRHLRHNRVRRQLFRREYDRLLLVPEHPNLVRVFPSTDDTDSLPEIDGRPLYQMEWVQGRSLREALGPGPLTLSQAVGYMTSIADAVMALHSNGIFHTDITSTNVIVSTSGGEQRVVLIDFSHARQEIGADENTPPAGEFRTGGGCTRGFCAPEQIARHRPDARTDIWQIGNLLLHLATGKLIYDGSSPKWEPPDLDDLGLQPSPALRRLLLRCLQRSQNRRPQARELLEGLRGTDEALSRAGAVLGMVAGGAGPERSKEVEPVELGPSHDAVIRYGLLLQPIYTFSFGHDPATPSWRISALQARGECLLRERDQGGQKEFQTVWVTEEALDAPFQAASEDEAGREQLLSLDLHRWIEAIDVARQVFFAAEGRHDGRLVVPAFPSSLFRLPDAADRRDLDAVFARWELGQIVVEVASDALPESRSERLTELFARPRFALRGDILGAASLKRIAGGEVRFVVLEERGADGRTFPDELIVGLLRAELPVELLVRGVCDTKRLLEWLHLTGRADAIGRVHFQSDVLCPPQSPEDLIARGLAPKHLRRRLGDHEPTP